MREIDFNNEKDNDLMINRHFVLAALIILKSTIWRDVRNLIKTTGSAGINVRLVSGDAKSTTKFFAMSCGIMNQVDEATNSNVI